MDDKKTDVFPDVLHLGLDLVGDVDLVVCASHLLQAGLVLLLLLLAARGVKGVEVMGVRIVQVKKQRCRNHRKQALQQSHGK